MAFRQGNTVPNTNPSRIAFIIASLSAHNLDYLRLLLLFSRPRPTDLSNKKIRPGWSDTSHPFTWENKNVSVSLISVDNLKLI